MKTDFITRKERIKAFNKAGNALAEFELNNPKDNLIAAANVLECAFINRQNAKESAYQMQLRHAIQLLQKEIH